MGLKTCPITWDYEKAERLAWHVAAGLGIGLIVAFALHALDSRVLAAVDANAFHGGEPVWIKPMRFCLAFGVHLVTIIWIGHLTSAASCGDRAYAAGLWLQAVIVIIEMACIVVQAGRGVHSHFNYSTRFDHAVFMIMGLGTAGTLVGLVMCARGVWRCTDKIVTRNLVTGAMALAVLGGLIGVHMVMPTAEQRAILDTGAKLAWIGGVESGVASGRAIPFFAWDLVAGDWRAPHFIGLHALQALPLLAWLASRQNQSGPFPAGIIVVFGASAYALLFVAVTAWTASSHSVFAVAVGGWGLLGLPAVIYGLAIVLLLWQTRWRHVG